MYHPINKGGIKKLAINLNKRGFQCQNKRYPAGIITNYPGFFQRLCPLWRTLDQPSRREGPIDEKTIDLIQLAAAAAIQSEGSVHSHTRRALQAGVTKEEIYHTLILLISILGFPRVSAAISWSRDVIDKEDRK